MNKNQLAKATNNIDTQMKDLKIESDRSWTIRDDSDGDSENLD